MPTKGQCLEDFVYNIEKVPTVFAIVSFQDGLPYCKAKLDFRNG